MFYILDGRDNFYQWDLNRQIKVEDSTIRQLHYCNRTDDCALIVDVVDGVADVPNILLQSTWDIRVYGYTGDYTKVEKRYKVLARSKPDNYIYEETKIKNYEDLAEQHKRDIYSLQVAIATAHGYATKAQQAADTAQQTAINAGGEAYSVKQQIQNEIKPTLTAHEERIGKLETDGGKETLIVEIVNGVPSHSNEFIFNYAYGGGRVMLYKDNNYLTLASATTNSAVFNYFQDDYMAFQYEIFQNKFYETQFIYATAEDLNNLQGTVGDIENALAEITALQASYIGGAE